MLLRCLLDTFYMQDPVFRSPLGPKVLTNSVNGNEVSYLDTRTPGKELKSRQCYFKPRKTSILKCRFCCYNSSYQLEVQAHLLFFMGESWIPSIRLKRTLYVSFKLRNEKTVTDHSTIALLCLHYLSYKKIRSNTLISLFPEKQSTLKFSIWTGKPAECIIQKAICVSFVCNPALNLKDREWMWPPFIWHKLKSYEH